MQVFYSSPWVPAEWIKAHGLEPRGVWFAEDFGRGALSLSAGVCAFAEAVVRFAEAHRDSVMIFTTACDQLRRAFDAFAGAGGSRALLFNLPATGPSEAGLRIFRAELERLGRFLQAHGGRAPVRESFVPLIAQRNAARNRLMEMACRCSARQFARAIAQFHWDGSISTTDQPVDPASKAIPIAIVGGPLGAAQWNLLDRLEAAGTRVVLNATETGERSLPPEIPLNRFHADPVGILAQSYLENGVDAFQRPNTRLYAWLQGRLSARGVRGIVLWVHTGCDLWRAEAQTLRDTFQRPVLLLEADEAQGASPRDVGRLEAFVETLR